MIDCNRFLNCSLFMSKVSVSVDGKFVRWLSSFDFVNFDLNAYFTLWASWHLLLYRLNRMFKEQVSSFSRVGI